MQRGVRFCCGEEIGTVERLWSPNVLTRYSCKAAFSYIQRQKIVGVVGILIPLYGARGESAATSRAALAERPSPAPDRSPRAHCWLRLPPLHLRAACPCGLKTGGRSSSRDIR